MNRFTLVTSSAFVLFATYGCIENDPVGADHDVITHHDSMKSEPTDTGFPDAIELVDVQSESRGDAFLPKDPVADITENDTSDDVTDTTEPALPPLSPPTYPHLDAVIDLHRGDVPVWAHLIDVDLDAEGAPTFREFSYGETAEQVDFWPASTIKIYPATAALTLLKQEGFSLDAEATFFHQSGGQWVKDVTKSFRDLVFESFNCSSNTAYTLLLRFAGVDWLNQHFFVPENGFDSTTLMVGYVSDRPYVYKRSEAQKIVVTEGDKSWERVHEFSGTSYHEQVGCTVSYGAGAANCSAPRDMTEHMKRLMFHEWLNEDSRFDARIEDLDWMRYEGSVMNNKETCGSHGWAGVKKVFQDADFYHKGGTVSAYRLDLQYVEHAATDTRYILAVVTQSGDGKVLTKLSEELARMVQTPRGYVHLENLQDNVNPVKASLVVYSEFGGTLELRVKDYELPLSQPETWKTLDGTASVAAEGLTSHELMSKCLEESGKLHIRGSLVSQDVSSVSDLHYVIVDADFPCP